MFTDVRNLINRLSVFGWTTIWWQPITPLGLRLSLQRLFYGSSHPLIIFSTSEDPSHGTFCFLATNWRLWSSNKTPESSLSVRTASFSFNTYPYSKCGTYRYVLYIVSTGICALTATTRFNTRSRTFFSIRTVPSGHWNTLPEPKDDDEQRYAFVASIVEALVAAFNWPLSMSIRRDQSNWSFDQVEDNPPPKIVAPRWATSVPPLREPLNIDDTVDQGMTPFVARNIRANNGHMHLI